MTVTDELRQAFAPTGVLRAALNHGNRVLVSRDEKGNAQGITVDLAHALAEELGLPLEFIHFEKAGDVTAAATQGVYDVCFLAVDPARAETIFFTTPYVQIEGRYLASASCDTQDAESLVAEGLKVAAVQGSAYTLELSRKPGAQNLVLFPDFASAIEAFDTGKVPAIAGIGAVMEKEAASRPGSRVLKPPFMTIRQAMGMPRGRPLAEEYLARFVLEMLKSRRVGEILERHGISADCAPRVG
ncbi:transporter substrate-binding domain-containing protein [Chelativorans composti]|jgi:ABC-type amino acid transport/signal transduction systems, periplasmic component/domain|uniref:Transporter substrate-binding domain-containing protein n=1 Tax=Chelativorans composti TaxID=768533 RepID=A0ABW5DEL6_9HYPH